MTGQELMNKYKFKYDIGDACYFKTYFTPKYGVISDRALVCMEKNDKKIYEEQYVIHAHEDNSEVIYISISSEDIFNNMEECFKFVLDKLDKLDTDIANLRNEAY